MWLGGEVLLHTLPPDRTSSFGRPPDELSVPFGVGWLWRRSSLAVHTEAGGASDARTDSESCWTVGYSSEHEDTVAATLCVCLLLQAYFLTVCELLLFRSLHDTLRPFGAAFTTPRFPREHPLTSHHIF